MPTTPSAPLILASGSPRRRDLLTRAGVHFEVMPANIAEWARPDELPEALAERLAREKGLAVARQVGNPPRRWVLGADTVVALDGEVLGKPGNPAASVEILGRLLGRQHRVWTGIALVDSRDLRVHSRAIASEVVLRNASREELCAYAKGGEPLDKAGAYALQGEGRRFVERVTGSQTNVIGLPLEETLALLRLARIVHEGA